MSLSKVCDICKKSVFSSGSSGRVREGPRNMKSMRPPLAVIFFMTYFHRPGGGGIAPRPLDPLLVFSFYFEIYIERNLRFLAKCTPRLFRATELLRSGPNIYRPQTKLRRLYFHRRVSVHGGGRWCLLPGGGACSRGMPGGDLPGETATVMDGTHPGTDPGFSIGGGATPPGGANI